MKITKYLSYFEDITDFIVCDSIAFVDGTKISLFDVVGAPTRTKL